MISASAKILKFDYIRWEHVNVWFLNLGMMKRSIEEFEVEGEQEKMVIFDKNLILVWMRYLSNFWVPPQYLIMGRA